MKSYNLELITPGKVVYKDQVESVIMPGYDGELGILADHEPGVIQLKPGIVSIRKKDKVLKYIILSGYAQISKAYLGIYVESAEKPEDININESKAKVDLAKSVLDRKDAKEEELISAKLTIEKELAKIKALGKIT